MKNALADCYPENSGSSGGNAPTPSGLSFASPAFACWVAYTSSLFSWRRRRGKRLLFRCKGRLRRYPSPQLIYGRVSLGRRWIWKFDHFSTPLLVFREDPHELSHNDLRGWDQYAFPVRTLLNAFLTDIRKNHFTVNFMSCQPRIFRESECTFSGWLGHSSDHPWRYLPSARCKIT